MSTPHCTATSWFEITGRGPGVVISLDQLPEESRLGDRLLIDGVLYEVRGIERPDMNGYRGFWVRAVSTPCLQDVVRAAIVDRVHQAGHLPVDVVIPDAAADVLVALRDACTVRTVEQFDALPEGVIIRDGHGDAWQRIESSMWMATGSEVRYRPSDPEMPTLPALLVWHPDWEAS